MLPNTAEIAMPFKSSIYLKSIKLSPDYYKRTDVSYSLVQTCVELRVQVVNEAVNIVYCQSPVFWLRFTVENWGIRFIITLVNNDNKLDKKCA